MNSEKTGEFEKNENGLDRLIAHEAAHVIVSEALGLPVDRLVLDVDRYSEGSVIWKSVAGVSERDKAIAYAAGFAGELLILGEEKMKSFWFGGYKTDSVLINRLGYTSQEQKAELVKEAMRLLKGNKEDYESVMKRLRQRAEEGTRKGEKFVEVKF